MCIRDSVETVQKYVKLLPEHLVRRFISEEGDAVLVTGRLPCLLYTSDAADERSSVDLGGRRIIKKNTE
mgnify:CR=1 FL=1